ncbi:MAG: agmatinase [Bdellovibrionales bacterium]
MEYKPLSGREFPRFSGIKTFFRMPYVEIDQDYDLGIQGVPFDGAVSYRPGCRFGPTRVREASSLGRGFHWTRGLNWVEKLKVADIGDCSVVPMSVEKSYELIEERTTEILSYGKKLISIGGDHSTTLPLLRSMYKKYGKLRLIHFDAHLDTYPAAWGCEFHHGAFVRHAVNEGLIDPAKSIQFGIRGPLAGAEDLDFVNQHKITVTTVDDIRTQGLESFLKNSIPELDDTPTYISFDIDCLDPAYAPGTGTPVPGGLTTYETQRILRSLKIPNLVGADVVEISPPFDSSEITALAGVDTVNELICLFADSF